jgi:hypothetical protein
MGQRRLLRRSRHVDPRRAGRRRVAATFRIASCRSDTIPSSNASRRIVLADSLRWMSRFSPSVSFISSNTASRPW